MKFLHLPVTSLEDATANFEQLAPIVAQPKWTGLALGTNYAAVGGEQAPQWALDGFGFVHVRGLVSKSVAWATTDTIATLPAGARPAATAYLWTRLNDATNGVVSALVGVLTTGVLKVVSTTPNVGAPGNLTSLVLDNMTFQQAQ